MTKEFYFKSSTGKDLFAKQWYDECANSYKGVIQLVHGMEEYISRYDEFAEFLASNGYIVVGHDHMGHGKSVKSDKELGHLDCKDGWFRLTEDIHILQNRIREKYPNIPYFIFGHSMGSLLVRTYITIYKDDVTGVIISGTSGQKSMLHLGVLLTNLIKLFKGPKYKSEFISKLVIGSFNDKFKPTRTPADWITRDEKAIDDYLKIINPNRKFTVESYNQLFKGNIYLNKISNIKKTLDIPILIFSGDHDPVGEMGKGVTRAYNNLKKVGIKDVTLKLFKDGRHEMLNELNKDEVFKYVIDWIDSKV